jgi:hypothetical protein
MASSRPIVGCSAVGRFDVGGGLGLAVDAPDPWMASRGPTNIYPRPCTFFMYDEPHELNARRSSLIWNRRFASSLIRPGHTRSRRCRRVTTSPRCLNSNIRMSKARLPNSTRFLPASKIRLDGIRRYGPNSKASHSSIVCKVGNLSFHNTHGS